MKKLLSIGLSLCLALALAFSLTACGGETSKAATSGFVAIDINPSVEFTVDADGNVTAVRAVNHDAEVTLADINLKGLKLEDATKKFVAAAESLGFINQTNKAVRIIAEGETAAETDKLEKEAESGANKGSDKAEVSVNSSKALTREIEELKKANPELYKNMSVAKLKLIKSIMSFDETFTVEKGATMKIKDLSEKLEDLLEDYEDLMSDSLKDQYEALIKEKLDVIDRKIEALYGEEYAAKAELKRVLEAKEDLFEDAFENRELSENDIASILAELDVTAEDISADGKITVKALEEYLDKLEDEWENLDDESMEDKLDLIDEMLDNYDDDETLTSDMIAELKELTGEDIADLDALEEFIDNLDDSLDEIKDRITLSAEDKATLEELKNQKKSVKSEVKELMKEKAHEHKEKLKEEKDKTLGKK